MYSRESARSPLPEQIAFAQRKKRSEEAHLESSVDHRDRHVGAGEVHASFESQLRVSSLDEGGRRFGGSSSSSPTAARTAPKAIESIP
jgi:hypothetical protein